MSPDNYEESSSELERILGREQLPIAVRLVANEEDTEVGSKELDECLRYCRLLIEAKGKGRLLTARP